MSQSESLRIKSHTSGLGNLGATCYINTVVQCLGYCQKFLEFILAAPRPQNRPTQLVDELRDIYMDLWVNGTSIAPYKFLNSLQQAFSDIFNLYEQNDISEFFMLYLDKLNADIAVELKVTDKTLYNIHKRVLRTNTDNRDFAEFAYKMELHWLNHIKREYSPLIDMFYGQLISQIVCGNCNHIHHNYEVYCDLSLPLPKNTMNTYSMDNVINSYFNDEVLQDCWKCDKCNVMSPSKKSIKLWRNPKILMICLKRFSSTLAKNNILVRAPLELDLTQYTINTSTHDKYRLKAIGNHCGSSLGSGHYNCCCRRTISGEWHAIDDALVRPATDAEVDFSLCQGYMYFYEGI